MPAAPTVTLYARPVMPDGSRPHLKPAYSLTSKLCHGYALIKGHPQPVNNPI